MIDLYTLIAFRNQENQKDKIMNMTTGINSLYSFRALEDEGEEHLDGTMREIRLKAYGKREATRIFVPIHFTPEFFEDNFQELQPYVLSWLESLEDEVIKYAHKQGLTGIFKDKISTNGIFDILEARNVLTIAQVEEWLESVLKPAMQEHLRAKGKTESIVSLTVLAFRTKFLILLKKGKLKVSEKEQLVKALELVPDSPMKSKLAKRIAAKTVLDEVENYLEL